MGFYRLKYGCPHCGGPRFIYEAWADGTIANYHVGCDDKYCKGYHIDITHDANKVRLDMVVARHGGLSKDKRTKSELTFLSKGLWGTGNSRIGKPVNCALCYTSTDSNHDDNCPVQVARELLKEIYGQSSPKRKQDQGYANQTAKGRKNDQKNVGQRAS